MIKFMLAAVSSIAIMYSSAFACDMRTDDLVPAEEMMETQSLEAASASAAFATCYARDRYGNMYSASHPHAGKAQEKALRQCEQASRALCWQAGCRRPSEPGYPGHGHGHGRGRGRGHRRGD